MEYTREIERPLFTIVIPVIRTPELMAFAIESVQKQTITDFELFVVGDGAPDETIAVAQVFAKADSRVKVFPYPKGKRNGELNRHFALEEARGKYVCHLCDDDLWFPEHLHRMKMLLDEVDFGHTLHTFLEPDGGFDIYLFDLSNSEVQQRMLTSNWNFFGHSVAGYRLETYRQLKEGWSPAPEDVWPDLHMWRKFLKHEGIRVGTSFHITAIQFKSPQRLNWTISERAAEIKPYLKVICDELAREKIWGDVLRRYSQLRSEQRGENIQALERHIANLESTNQHQLQTINEILSSTSWRLSYPVRLIGSLIMKFKTYTRRS